jgi:hypothetical protein
MIQNVAPGSAMNSGRVKNRFSESNDMKISHFGRLQPVATGINYQKIFSS